MLYLVWHGYLHLSVSLPDYGPQSSGYRRQDTSAWWDHHLRDRDMLGLQPRSLGWSSQRAGSWRTITASIVLHVARDQGGGKRRSVIVESFAVQSLVRNETAHRSRWCKSMRIVSPSARCRMFVSDLERCRKRAGGAITERGYRAVPRDGPSRQKAAFCYAHNIQWFSSSRHELCYLWMASPKRQTAIQAPPRTPVRRGFSLVAGSAVQGDGKRHAGLAIISCSWPPLVELVGHRPTDQSSFFLRLDAP